LADIMFSMAISQHPGQSAASLDMFNRHSSNLDRGNNIISNVLRHLHTATRNMWPLSRNQSLHNRSDARAQDIYPTEMAGIRHFHSNPRLLPTGDQHYCEHLLASLICSPRSVRRRWLKHIRSARAVQPCNGLLQTNISNFFTAAKTPRIAVAPRGSPSPPLAG
jgi:hypothetical protein